MDKYYMAEIHIYQQEMMIVNGKMKSEEGFRKIWDSYKKSITVIQDAMNAKMISGKIFGEESEIYKDIQQSYKEYFNLFYGEDERLNEYLY